MKDIEELKIMIKNAYKNSNFFDSQHKIEELKKDFDVKILAKLIRKEYNLCKADEKDFMKEYDILQNKYLLRHKVYLWSEALKYVTHRYKHGEWVLFHDYNELNSGQIIKINTRGYKIFTGRKMGVHINVLEKDVICHVSNTRAMSKAFTEKNKENKKNEL